MQRTALLQTAGQAIAQGDFSGASKALQKLLGANSSDVDALGMLAAVAERTGDFTVFTKALSKGLKHAPSHPVLLYFSGLMASRQGRLDEAIAALNKAIGIAPGFMEATIALGSSLGQAGRHEDAWRSLTQASRSFPQSHLVQFNLGVAALQFSRAEDAVRAFQAASRLEPGNVDAWAYLGLALIRLDRHDEALMAANTGLAVTADHAFARQVAGDALQLLDRSAEAYPHYAEAARLAPHDPDPAICAAQAMIGMGRPDLARAALEEIVQRFPDSHTARLVLARACMDNSKPEQAIAQWSAVAERQPERGDVWSLLGQGRILVGDFAAGVSALERAIGLGEVDARFHLATALPGIPMDRQEIGRARERFLTETNSLTASLGAGDGHKISSGGTFLLAYHDEDSLHHRRAYGQLMQAAMPRLRYNAPHCENWRSPQRRRPRVGFVSRHLFDHTIHDLFRGTILGLDQDRFESVLLFPPGPSDGVRADLHGRAECSIDLPNDIFAAQRMIGDAELDALIFLDVGMQPEWDLLAYGRLAPLQATFWGHPETTGIPTMDAFLSCDAMEPANGEEHYWERLVRLPGPSLLIGPLAEPAVTGNRADFGLPEGATLYICPQSLFKLHPDFDRGLAEILRADHKAVVVLLKSPSEAMADHWLARFRLSAPDVADRIHFLSFVPKQAFPALLSVCDVMLDPFHYSGGHTTLTAFSVGLPVVTWPGRFMRGRHAFGFCQLMGMDELIAPDQSQYVTRAVSIANDRDHRRRLSQDIGQKARECLFNDHQSLIALQNWLLEQMEGGT